MSLNWNHVACSLFNLACFISVQSLKLSQIQLSQIESTTIHPDQETEHCECDTSPYCTLFPSLVYPSPSPARVIAFLNNFYVFCSLSHVRLFATPWTAACQASLSFTNFWSLLKLISIESVMPSNQLIICSPLLLLPSIFPSIRVFSNESVLCIRWPMDESFSFSISLSNKYSRVISFRIDWFDLLAVQGDLKSLL